MLKSIVFIATVISMGIQASPVDNLVAAIKKDDFKSIEAIVFAEPKRVSSWQGITGILQQAYSEQVAVRAGAVWALAQLAKQGKLSARELKEWSSIANEPGYAYNSEPYWADACKTTIYQLGIHNTPRGRMGMAHAIAGVGAISNALRRITMSEEFFVVAGEGEFWLKNRDGSEKLFTATPGDHFLNPCGQVIQFKNTGQTDLKILVITMPPYDEVIKSEGDIKREIVEVRGRWEILKTK